LFAFSNWNYITNYGCAVDFVAIYVLKHRTPMTLKMWEVSESRK
jgi:hypothetical protein